jgi:hypothetical protein
MMAWCPEGAVHNPIQQLCMTSTHAIGPFSHEMIRSCENARGAGSQECHEQNWDIFFAGVLRGTSRCAPGTNWENTLQACTDSEFAYGPFSDSQVGNCKQLNWGFSCEIMRWPLDILRGRKAPAAPTLPRGDTQAPPLPLSGLSGFSGRLISYYTQPENYRKVYADVMGWFGTTHNACVAFISTALRQAGLAVPKQVNSRGYNISTWTAALSEYLEFSQRWQRISDLRELRPGDIVFTLDSDGSRNIPAHVFLFVAWTDSVSAWARVVDNQGFLHRRNLSAHNGGNFTPFNYALRAPY